MAVVKLRIPVALREQVWIRFNGRKFERKCYIKWCKNIITVFDFHVGHNIPESKGGPNTLDNLRPICSRCNQSMSNNYTIDQWNELGKKSSRCGGLFNCCTGFIRRNNSVS
jgi:5-methylcytosine-specific restriction endonuclease McrA